MKHLSNLYRRLKLYLKNLIKIKYNHISQYIHLFLIFHVRLMNGWSSIGRQVRTNTRQVLDFTGFLYVISNSSHQFHEELMNINY